MSVTPRQQNRAAILKTPLGEDRLVVSRFDGSEGVSELFEYRIEALSKRNDVDFDELLGKNVTLTIKAEDGRERHFDGILAEAQWVGERHEYLVYRLVLRPWLWLMSHRSDCFIFHNKSVPEMISDVFERHSFAQFEDRTNARYPPIEYCVQYRETDMAFVCRLMEQYGISYFFLHEEGFHKLVLVDQNSQFELAPGDTRPYRALAGQDRRSEESFSHWIPERRFTSGRLTFRDYNFKKPTAQMESDRSGTASYEHAGMELYDYPGKYVQRSEGTQLVTSGLQAEEALDRRCLASGNCLTLFPGCLVRLREHSSSYDAEYALLRAQHSFVSQQYRSGAGAAAEQDYDGRYELLNSDIPFRPAHITPTPLVHGPQTAIVVGPEGEEIDCDEYGRILVRFHWDRKNDQSMRCRVSQSWSSRQWGGIVIPRIGMEVVVEFLEGDPDRPIVTGCVYNGDNVPPYELPANKTRTTFKSRTHKGAGYNELRFEDEQDQEEVWFHAQKYHNGVVEEDETWQVGRNRHIAVGGSESEAIGNDLDVSVGRHHRMRVGGSDNLVVNKSRASHIQGSDSLNVGEDQASSVGGEKTVSIGGNFRLDTGGNQFTSAGTSHFIQAGQTVVIEAGLSICLSVGGSYLMIDPSGIQIEGPLVRINCGGAPSQGMSVPPIRVEEPDPYHGPHAERYARSFKK